MHSKETCSSVLLVLLVKEHDIFNVGSLGVHTVIFKTAPKDTKKEKGFYALYMF